MSADEEISENPPSTEIAMTSPALCIALESLTSGSPYSFCQMPIDCNSRIFKERANKSFGAARSCDQLCEYWCGHDQSSAIECGVKSVASGQGNPRVRVPQGDKNVRVNRGCHRQLIRSVVVAAHFPQPSINGLLARWDPGIADAAILLEYALAANRPDVHSVVVALESQPVPWTDAQDSADLDGNGDLPFACNFRFFRHGDFQFLTLAHFPYLEHGIPEQRKTRRVSCGLWKSPALPDKAERKSVRRMPVERRYPALRLFQGREYFLMRPSSNPAHP